VKHRFLELVKSFKAKQKFLMKKNNQNLKIGKKNDWQNFKKTDVRFVLKCSTFLRKDGKNFSVFFKSI